MGDNGGAGEAGDGPNVPRVSEAAGLRVTGGICHGVHINPFTDLVKDLSSCGAALGRATAALGRGAARVSFERRATLEGRLSSFTIKE